MINTKTHRPRREIGKISNDGHHLVPAFVSKNQIVSCVVNDDVIGMVRERSDAICDEQTQPPVAKPECSHSKCDGRLHEHDRSGDQCCPRIAHHQLPDFRMGFDDGTRPTRVRLFGFRLIKRCLHGSKLCIAGASSNALFHGAPDLRGFCSRSAATPRGRLWLFLFFTRR